MIGPPGSLGRWVRVVTLGSALVAVYMVQEESTEFQVTSDPPTKGLLLSLSEYGTDLFDPFE